MEKIPEISIHELMQQVRADMDSYRRMFRGAADFEDKLAAELSEDFTEIDNPSITLRNNINFHSVIGSSVPEGHEDLNDAAVTSLIENRLRAYLQECLEG